MSEISSKRLAGLWWDQWHIEIPFGKQQLVKFVFNNSFCGGCESTFYPSFTHTHPCRLYRWRWLPVTGMTLHVHTHTCAQFLVLQCAWVFYCVHNVCHTLKPKLVSGTINNPEIFNKVSSTFTLFPNAHTILHTAGRFLKICLEICYLTQKEHNKPNVLSHRNR